jgi:CBS domain-containing protein
MNEYRVQDVMTRLVISVPENSPLKDVIGLLHEKETSCVVIVEDARPIGIVTERDMVRILADMLDDVVWDDLSIHYFMTTPTITIDQEMLVIDAANLARKHSIRNLPVTDEEGILIGLLTQSNIVSAYYHESMDLVREQNTGLYD